MMKTIGATILAGYLLSLPTVAIAGCEPATEPRKPSALTGLLGAARQAGLAEALTAQGGGGRNGQLASALLGAAISGDPVSVAPTSDDPQVARLAGVAVAAASAMAAGRGCGDGRSQPATQAPPTGSPDTADLWR